MLRHPYWSTYREQSAETFREELAAFLRRQEPFKARLATARVLEAADV